MKLCLQSKQWKYKFLFFMFLPLFIPQIVNADNSQADTAGAAPYVLPEVHVEAARIAPTTGMAIIDKEMIENLPTRNGSVNEIIGIVPGVQYSEESLSSFTGGEITPPVVSIAGSRFYDNNYTIDGISNNNPLDPALVSTNFSISKLPSHPQIHFLNPQLIDQITIYNSNIPAEFGGFTGGQVDTKTINSTTDFWGKIHIRLTNDGWTNFHIRPDKSEDFYNSNSSEYQPKFKKRDVGFILNTPVNFDTSLLTSYQQLDSRIRLHHLDGFNTQSRKHENFFFKLNHYHSNGLNLSITALYSPTATQSFLKSFKAGDYTIDSQSYSLAITAEKDFDNYHLNFTLGYTGYTSERVAPENRFYWSTATDSIDWSSGNEGGSGVLKTGQDTLSIKADIESNSMNFGQTYHTFKLGGEATYSSQYYHRPKTNYSYTTTATEKDENGNKIIIVPTSCLPNDLACIENEQYLSRRTVYQQAKSTAELTTLTGFIQDALVWKRLEVFPGIRISYDNHTGDINIAPRLATSLDVFGNQSTILFAGKNRYYSGTLLTHALYKGIITSNQVRSSYLDDWTDTSTSTRYEDGEIKTPYSDELTIGIMQKFLGGKFKIQYIAKKNKNELARSKTVNRDSEPDVYVFNNLGRSDHESLQVSWQKSWKNHLIEINSTWQETTTSHDNYTDFINEEDTAETIWYKGKELYYYEIPRKDFNRPVIANFIYTCNLPYNLTFTNTTKYRGAYWKLWKSRDENNDRITRPSIVNPEQSDPYVYERVKSNGSLIFDWSFIWKIPDNLSQNLTFSLDILNVFNTEAKIMSSTNPDNYDYELGRQIWAGLEFNF